MAETKLLPHSPISLGNLPDELIVKIVRLAMTHTPALSPSSPPPLASFRLASVSQSIRRAVFHALTSISLAPPRALWHYSRHNWATLSHCRALRHLHISPDITQISDRLLVSLLHVLHRSGAPLCSLDIALHHRLTQRSVIWFAKLFGEKAVSLRLRLDWHDAPQVRRSSEDGDGAGELELEMLLYDEQLGHGEEVEGGDEEEVEGGDEEEEEEEVGVEEEEEVGDEGSEEVGDEVEEGGEEGDEEGDEDEEGGGGEVAQGEPNELWVYPIEEGIIGQVAGIAILTQQGGFEEAGLEMVGQLGPAPPADLDHKMYQVPVGVGNEEKLDEEGGEKGEATEGTVDRELESSGGGGAEGNGQEDREGGDQSAAGLHGNAIVAMTPQAIEPGMNQVVEMGPVQVAPHVIPFQQGYGVIELPVGVGVDWGTVMIQVIPGGLGEDGGPPGSIQDPLGDVLSGPVLAALLARMPNLRHFGLDNALYIMSTGISHIAKCPQLESLVLTGIPGVNSFVMRPILAAFTKLRRLRLEGMPLVGNLTLAAICEGPLHATLEQLEMSRLGNVTDEGVRQLVSECKVLQSVRISMCMRVTGESVSHLSCAPALRHLDYRPAVNKPIKDHIVRCISCASGRLHSLQLARCRKLSVKGLGFLMRLPALRKLHLKGMGRVGCDAMQVLGQFPKLEDLSLEGYMHLTDCAVKVLCQRRGYQLQYLSLRDMCQSLTDEVLESLTTWCTSLRIVEVYGNFREGSFLKLREGMPTSAIILRSKAEGMCSAEAKRGFWKQEAEREETAVWQRDKTNMVV